MLVATSAMPSTVSAVGCRGGCACCGMDAPYPLGDLQDGDWLAARAEDAGAGCLLVVLEGFFFFWRGKYGAVPFQGP